MTQATNVITAGNTDDPLYAEVQAAVQRRYAALTAEGAPLFTTDVDTEALWATYLAAFPSEERQHHTCHTCRSFVRHFGGLVSLTPNGDQIPLVWPEDVPAPYATAYAACARLVSRARPNGVFYSSSTTLGTAQTGPWHHVALTNAQPWTSKAQTAQQAAAAKAEDVRTVQTALGTYTPDQLAQALTILESPTLTRNEVAVSQARWLHDLAVAWRGARRDSPRATRLLWRTVATAPAGFCHPRSSMLGTLLDDLSDGLSLDVITARWAAKVNALQYQRPQAAPAAGTIAQAETLFAKLELAPALARRYAQLDDLQLLWQPPTPQPAAQQGVFGHLKPAAVTLPVQTSAHAQPISWTVFARDVLPTVEEISVRVPAHGPFVAMVTAVDPAAPPILQWDRLEQRNPVSWYVYANGSSAQQWGLVPGWLPLVGITLQPSMWYVPEHNTHNGQSVMLLLPGLADSRHSGLSLFPEILRGELHGVRSVIEAYSKHGQLVGAGQPHAGGLKLQAGQHWTKTELRVRRGTVTLTYLLDRWE